MGLSFGGLILFALLGTAVQSWLRVDIVPLGVSTTVGWDMAWRTWQQASAVLSSGACGVMLSWLEWALCPLWCAQSGSVVRGCSESNPLWLRLRGSWQAQSLDLGLWVMQSWLQMNIVHHGVHIMHYISTRFDNTHTHLQQPKLYWPSCRDRALTLSPGTVTCQPAFPESLPAVPSSPRPFSHQASSVQSL